MDTEFVRMLYENPEYYNTIKDTVIKKIHYKIPADIENCIHDVYLLIMKEKLKPEHENIKGWLYKASVNVARTHNKKISSLLKSTLEVDGNTPATYKLDFDVIEELEYKRVLNEIIEENILSPNDKKFINLKFIKKLSNEEISKILNIEKDSVVKKATRLRTKIKEIIKDRLT